MINLTVWLVKSWPGLASLMVRLVKNDMKSSDLWPPTTVLAAWIAVLVHDGFLIDRLADLARSSEYVPHDLWVPLAEISHSRYKVINFAAIESLIISRLI
jgi:hypothetical protein